MDNTRLLTLEHSSYPHTEFWFLTEDGEVYIEGDYPCNYPTTSKHTLSPLEALRQFALLTSSLEGWEITMEYPGWHEFVMSIDIKVETNNDGWGFEPICPKCSRTVPGGGICRACGG